MFRSSRRVPLSALLDLLAALNQVFTTVVSSSPLSASRDFECFVYFPLPVLSLVSCRFPIDLLHTAPAVERKPICARAHFLSLLVFSLLLLLLRRHRQILDVCHSTDGRDDALQSSSHRRHLVRRCAATRATSASSAQRKNTRSSSSSSRRPIVSNHLSYVFLHDESQIRLVRNKQNSTKRCERNSISFSLVIQHGGEAMTKIITSIFRAHQRVLARATPPPPTAAGGGVASPTKRAAWNESCSAEDAASALVCRRLPCVSFSCSFE